MLTSRPEQLGQRGVSLFDVVTKVVAAGVIGIQAIAWLLKMWGRSPLLTSIVLSRRGFECCELLFFCAQTPSRNIKFDAIDQGRLKPYPGCSMPATCPESRRRAQLASQGKAGSLGGPNIIDGNRPRLVGAPRTYGRFQKLDPRLTSYQSY